MPKKTSSHGSRLPFSLFLGIRYLQPKRTFVSLITLVSVVGVMLGIAVLIIVIAVMSGFEKKMKEEILSFESSLVVTNNGIIDDWEAVMEEVKKAPEVTGVSPFVMGPVLATHNNRVMAPRIRGIELEFERTVSAIDDYMKDGVKADLDGDKAIVGSVLANQFNLTVGDKILMFSPTSMNDVLTELDVIERKTVDEMGKEVVQPTDVTKKSLEDLRQMVLPVELTVSGIFETGRNAYDSEYIIVPLYVAQELYSLNGGVHGLTGRTEDPYRVGIPQTYLNAKLAQPLHCLTWQDMNAQLLNVLANERGVMFLLLFIVLLVAAFCVMNTMITVTVQKTREIGVMKAIGANTPQIVWVFLFQGMLVGIYGNIAGLGLAMTLLHFRNDVVEWFARTMHKELFPQSIYQFAEIPAYILPKDLAVICVSGFFVCALAALIPAWFASRLEPVKALRHE